MVEKLAHFMVPGSRGGEQEIGKNRNELTERPEFQYTLNAGFQEPNSFELDPTS